MLRRAIDWLVALLARVAVLGLFRRVEVDGRHRIPRGRPVVLVANHFNGFVDPVVLAVVLGRLPRFVAKATLAKVVVIRPLLALAGVVLVQRREDHEGTAGNVSAFAACHRVLRKGATVAIFPEGTTHDEARLAPVRTGAARIALGARAAGAAGLWVLPVGLTFPDKIALRSKVLVRVGEPIDLDAELGRFVAEGEPVDETNHRAVEALTTEIDRRLRAVSPDFADVEEWLTLDRAAEVTLRATGPGEPTLAARAELAHRLGRADEAGRTAVRRAVADYTLDCELAHVTDRDVDPDRNRLAAVRRLVVPAVAVVAALPVVLTGLLVNLVPFLLVNLASLRTRTPVTKGTVRLLTSLVLFPLTWFTTAVVTVDGAAAVLATAALLAVGGFVALVAIEGMVGVARSLAAWRGRVERAALLERLRHRRAEVVAAVTAVADGVAG